MNNQTANESLVEKTIGNIGDFQNQPTFLDRFFKPVYTNDSKSYGYDVGKTTEFFFFPEDQITVCDWKNNQEVIQQLVYHKAMDKFFSLIEEIKQIALRNRLGGSSVFLENYEAYYVRAEYTYGKPNQGLAKCLKDHIDNMVATVFQETLEEVSKKHGVEVIIGCHKSMFDAIFNLLSKSPFPVDYTLTSTHHPLMNNRIVMGIATNDPNDGIYGFGINTNSYPLFINEEFGRSDEPEEEDKPEKISLKQDWVLTTPVVCDLHFPNLRA